MSFDFSLSLQVLLTALLIFVLRVFSLAFDTIRIICVVRGKKALAWWMGFFTVLLFVVALTMVLAKTDNLFNLICFAAGFATGTVVGIQIEERLAYGHVQLNIVSPAMGECVAANLRQSGFAATEIPARGMGGSVTMVKCDVRRKHIARVERIVYETDAQAFVTIQEVKPIQRGYWGGGRT